LPRPISIDYIGRDRKYVMPTEIAELPMRFWYMILVLYRPEPLFDEWIKAKDVRLIKGDDPSAHLVLNFVKRLVVLSLTILIELKCLCDEFIDRLRSGRYAVDPGLTVQERRNIVAHFLSKRREDGIVSCLILRSERLMLWV